MTKLKTSNCDQNQNCGWKKSKTQIMTQLKKYKFYNSKIKKNMTNLKIQIVTTLITENVRFQNFNVIKPKQWETQMVTKLKILQSSSCDKTKPIKL